MVYNELTLFAGCGGGILGSRLLGWNTIGAVEIEEYPRSILLQRQKDGCFEKFPVWDDIRTFDGRPWRGLVDVLSGGFPCQDISCAGEGKGLAGDRSGLWFEYQRIIEEIGPRFVFAENSPLLRTRGLGTILKELDGMGYDARWCVLGARHVGANHRRNRMWILAYPNNVRLEEHGHMFPEGPASEGSQKAASVSYPDTGGCDRGATCICQERRETSERSEVDSESVSYADVEGLERRNEGGVCERSAELSFGTRDFSITGHDRCGWWNVEPDLGRVANGIPNRVDRVKAIGNAQVPLVAATAFKILSNGLV